MQAFTNFRHAAACGVLGAVLAPAVLAASPQSAPAQPAAPSAVASAAAPVVAPAPPAAAAPAGSLAEAQQRLEQAAKDVARLSGGGGDREVRVIRMQRSGKGDSAEFTTTDVEGALGDLPAALPPGAHVTVVRSLSEGAPAEDAVGEGPAGELHVVRGPESIREIRVFRNGEGPQHHAGFTAVPGMHGAGKEGSGTIGRWVMGPGMHGPGPRARGPARIEFMTDGPLADLELANLTPALGRYFGTEKGVLVVHANDALKLQDGDVLRSIGGRVPTDEHHAMRILGSYAPGEAVKLEVLRDRKKVQVDTTLPAAEPGKVKRRMRVEVGTPPRG